MKLAILFGLWCAGLYGQCGALAINPTTGKLDCTGASSVGATGPTGPAGATGATGAIGVTGGGGGVVTYSTASTVALTGTIYLPFGGGAESDGTETNVQTKVQAAGTVANFAIKTDAVLAGGSSVIWTVRQNAAGTSVTCTQAAASNTCSDTTHSFSAAAADLLDVQGVITGTLPGIAPIVTFSIQFGTTNSNGVVNTGTINRVAYYPATGTTVDDSADFTIPSSVLTAGASGKVDLSAASGTDGLKVPVAAGAAPTANGAVSYDSTANDLEYGDNGTNRKVANLDEAQTLTNKTLTTPTIGDLTNATHNHSNNAGGANLTSAAFASGSAMRNGGFGAVFNGGGTALTAGSTAGTQVVYMVVPYACTVIAWDVTVDAGTAGFRVWRKATGTAIPTAADTVTSVGDLAIASGTALHSTTATNWSGGAFPTLVANDIIAVQLNAVATATLASFGATCQK